jgi:hypothetical protein
MIRQSILMLAAAFPLAFASAGSQAQEMENPIAVVELFTSQGCSSCPPADAFLGDLVKRGDVVALAYHVDYWDYLGWKDTLASTENTARQRSYGRSFGASSVYTPQMVVNGRAHMAGSRRTAVANAIDDRVGTPEGLTVDLSASYSGDNLVIEAGPGDSGGRKAHVVLVNFDAASTVEIKRGENRGKSLTYHNAVTNFQTVGVWKGKAARFELPMNEIARKGSGGCAVLLQEAGANGLPGAILGATMVVFPSG